MSIAGGPAVVVTPVRLTLRPALFVYVALGSRKLSLPGLFPCAPAELGLEDEILRDGDSSKTMRLGLSPYGA